MKATEPVFKYESEFIDALKILTPREIEILEKVGKGYTSTEIGRELFISEKTVQKHRETICRKLDLNGYRSLFHWCQRYMSGNGRA